MRERREISVFFGYLVTGAVTQCIDLGSFLGLVRLRVPIEISVVVAFVITAIVHFTICKFVNFRSFARSTSDQAGTYTTVACASLLLSVSVVSALSHGLHASPLVAKITAVAVSLPFNYLCNRFLTFGGGIRGAIATLRLQRVEGGDAASARDRLSESA